MENPNLNLFQKAYALGKAGDLNSAAAIYQAIIGSDPKNIEALNSLAFVEIQRSNNAEGIRLLHLSLEINPQQPATHYNLGVLLQQVKRYSEAVYCYDRAIALKPDFSEAHNNRGNMLQEMKFYNEALLSYDQVIALKPDNPDAYNNRGNTFLKMMRFNDALENYDKCIALNPNRAFGYYGRGSAMLEMKRYDEAVESFNKSRSINPDAPYLLGNFLHAKMHICDWQGIDADFAALAQKIDAGNTAATPFTVLPTPLSIRQQQACAETFVKNTYPPNYVKLWNGEKYTHDLIRIGYFSSDFRNQALAYLMAEFFELHDRSKFEITAFAFGPSPDDQMRRRLKKSFEHFIEVSNKSDVEIARLARSMEIDIAVDLNGFTTHARTGIFSMRPAPVQVSYLGFPGTMGASYIDYIFVDPIIVPENQKQYYTEKKVFLPNTYWVIDSTKNVSEKKITREQMGLPEDGFVFCCFNNSFKITPDVFEIWMRLLSKIEGSVMWLFEANPISVNNLRAEAKKRGISNDRLVFAKRIDVDSHLARHKLADLFLDTFYYNAHTTTSDALWVGQPVVTCIGKTFAGRVAASLLNAAKLPELITHSPAEYEALAFELATNKKKLSALRRKLEKNRTTCPLFDTKLFTRHFEDAYIAMHKKSAAGLPPDDIYIEA